jgi:hypothetical protein
MEEEEIKGRRGKKILKQTKANLFWKNVIKD